MVGRSPSPSPPTSPVGGQSWCRACGQRLPHDGQERCQEVLAKLAPLRDRGDSDLAAAVLERWRDYLLKSANAPSLSQ